MIFPECFAFYPEKFCKFSRTLFRKCLYPQLLNSSINFTKLFFSVYDDDLKEKRLKIHEKNWKH